jgi:hypothetical protein
VDQVEPAPPEEPRQRLQGGEIPGRVDLPLDGHRDEAAPDPVPLEEAQVVGVGDERDLVLPAQGLQLIEKEHLGGDQAGHDQAHLLPRRAHARTIWRMPSSKETVCA